MELTREQIHYIDNRLKEDGIKHWDVRIEMLDHVVSDVENRTENGERFIDAVKNSFISLGWNGSFKDKMESKQVQNQKNYRTLFSKEFRRFFTSFKTISIFIVLIFFGYCFYESKTFLKIILLSFIIPYCVFIIYSIVHYKKVYKSIDLSLSFSNASFSITLFNLLFYLPKVFFEIEKLSPIYLTLITILLFPIFYISIKIFYQSYKKTNNLYLKLIKE